MPYSLRLARVPSGAEALAPLVCGSAGAVASAATCAAVRDAAAMRADAESAPLLVRLRVGQVGETVMCLVRVAGPAEIAAVGSDAFALGHLYAAARVLAHLGVDSGESADVLVDVVAPHHCGTWDDVILERPADVPPEGMPPTRVLRRALARTGEACALPLPIHALGTLRFALLDGSMRELHVRASGGRGRSAWGFVGRSTRVHVRAAKGAPLTPAAKWLSVGGRVWSAGQRRVGRVLDLALGDSPELARVGMDPPRVVLVSGGAGVGKYYAVRVAAGRHGVPCVDVAACWHMGGNVRHALSSTFAHTDRALLCLRHTHLLLPHHGGDSSLAAHMVALADTLPRGAVLVLLATHADDIHATLRRAVTDHVHVDIPTPDEREQLARVLCAGLPLARDADAGALARRCHGMSVRELQWVVMHAHTLALRGGGGGDEDVVRAAHLEAARAAAAASAHTVHLDVRDPRVTWDAVLGMEAVKARLEEAVLFPLRERAQLERMGLHGTPGVLLCGPSGTGKTMLAEALAHAGACNYMPLQVADLVRGYVGESERALSAAFARARARAPCILFLDHIDAIVGAGEDADARLLAQLVREMDRAVPGVVVVAATAVASDVPAALRRPGRLEHVVQLAVPTHDERVAVLRALLEPLAIDDSVRAESVAGQCAGMSVAALQSLLTAAGLAALQRDAAASAISAADIQAALARTRAW